MSSTPPCASIARLRFQHMRCIHPGRTESLRTAAAAMEVSSATRSGLLRRLAGSAHDTSSAAIGSQAAVAQLSLLVPQTSAQEADLQLAHQGWHDHISSLCASRVVRHSGCRGPACCTTGFSCDRSRLYCEEMRRGVITLHNDAHADHARSPRTGR